MSERIIGACGQLYHALVQRANHCNAGTAHPLVVYDSIDAFYAAEPAAARSGETDFGVWWRDDFGRIYRVSWVQDTGHLYAIGMVSGEVTVIGVVRDEAELERRLEGWADACGPAGSIHWVLNRMPCPRCS